jgi:hypothetical protein
VRGACNQISGNRRTARHITKFQAGRARQGFGSVFHSRSPGQRELSDARTSDVFRHTGSLVWLLDAHLWPISRRRREIGRHSAKPTLAAINQHHGEDKQYSPSAATSSHALVSRLFSKPHARPATILRYEDYAGGFERTLNCGKGCGIHAPVSLEPYNRVRGDVSGCCELSDRHSQNGSRAADLRSNYHIAI